MMLRQHHCGRPAPPPHAVPPALSTRAFIVGGGGGWKSEIRNPKSELIWGRAGGNSEFRIPNSSDAILRPRKMTFPFPYRSDLEAMLRLALPVVVVQVGMMLLGVVNTMVVGRLSFEALAAVALGHVTVVAVVVRGRAAAGLDPLVAQAVVLRHRQRAANVRARLPDRHLSGRPLRARRRRRRRAVDRRGSHRDASAGGSHVAPRPWASSSLFCRARQLAGDAQPAIVVTIVVVNLSPGGGLGRWSSRRRCSATRVPRATTGGWNSPSGLALARGSRPLSAGVDREALRAQPLRRIHRLGTPIGFQVQLEILAFAVIALLMGGLGTLQMAAHQVTINLASLTFMVPLGVGPRPRCRLAAP